MKKLIFTFLVVNCSFLIVNSQVNQQWVARFDHGKGYRDSPFSMVLDASANVYVTGITYTSALYSEDYCTIKYNSSGVQQWVAFYNDPLNYQDIAYDVATDNSGNVYVTGYAFFVSTSNSDFCTIKYNANGVFQWLARYNGPYNSYDIGARIVVDNSGNVYVTGESTQSGGTIYDYATVKYNAGGVQQWAQRYNGPGNSYDYALDIALDDIGNVYVTGESYGSGTASDFCTIKYNNNGVLQWLQRYNGSANSYDEADAIALDANGNVYVTGYSDRTGSQNYDFCTIKYNSTGILQWVQTYNGPANSWDEANAVAVDLAGNVYVTGYSRSGSSFGTEDYLTIKYSSAGVQQWVQRYNGPANAADQAYSVSIDNSANVYVTGGSAGAGSGFDYCTIRYNTDGVQQWIQRYNGPGNNYDRANPVVLDSMGNVYVTGTSDGGFSGYDFCTIKYSQLVGIHPVSNELPGEFKLYQNFPNPFNAKTVISFQLAVNSFASLKVYDLLGREVAILVNEQLQPGTYEIDWDGTNYPSRMYFYVLSVESFKETRRMVLLK